MHLQQTKTPQAILEAFFYELNSQLSSSA